MNAHYKKVVDEINKRNPANSVINYLFDKNFINKYFPESEFNDEILSDEQKNEFNRRLKVALTEAVEVLNNRRILLLVLSPFMYFFGGIIRDIWIEFENSRVFAFENTILFYGIWFLWLLSFIYPLFWAFIFHAESKSIKNYIRLELDNTSLVDKPFNSKVNSYEGHCYSSRLRELDKLLEEGLISQSEYDQKLKSILKDL